MIWLGIDGALGAFSAALVASDGAFAPRTASASGNDALEKGLALIDEVLDGLSLEAVGAIAVGLGPGGFTGLRIALSYAKGLAFAAGLPLAGVSSYDALGPPPAADAADAPAHAHDTADVTFIHGRAGIACARLRLPPTALGVRREHVVCGTYTELASDLARVIGPGGYVRVYGNAQGAASALGERDLTVLPASSSVVVPALAIVRYAAAAVIPGNPHALRADYGEAHYAERPSVVPAPTNLGEIARGDSTMGRA